MHDPGLQQTTWDISTNTCLPVACNSAKNIESSSYCEIYTVVDSQKSLAAVTPAENAPQGLEASFCHRRNLPQELNAIKTLRLSHFLTELAVDA
jgi:hypothetical protein